MWVLGVCGLDPYTAALADILIFPANLLWHEDNQVVVIRTVFRDPLTRISGSPCSRQPPVIFDRISDYQVFHCSPKRMKLVACGTSRARQDPARRRMKAVKNNKVAQIWRLAVLAATRLGGR